MPEVLLDTNFMMSCLKEKVDFVDRLKEMDFDIIVPVEVIKELERVSISNKKMHFREDARLVLKILEKNSFKKVIVGGKYPDAGIVRYLKQNPKIYLATMDKELKRKVKNLKIALRARKKLEIV